MSVFLRSTGPPGTSDLTASLSAEPANIGLLERVGPVESDSKESSEPAGNDSDAFYDISQFQHVNDNLPALPAVAQIALTDDLTIVECNPEDQPASALADSAVSGLYAEGTMHEQAMKVTAYSSDPAEWQQDITDDMLEYFSRIRVSNTTSNFSSSARTYPDGGARTFSATHFMRTKINGEMIQRQWLIYSPTGGCVFLCTMQAVFSILPSTDNRWI